MGGPALVDGKTIEEFDNFEYTPFIYKGKEYISSEQAYQSQKFQDKEYAEKIRKTTQSTLIWSMGQSHEYSMKKNFDRIKKMTKILRAKFSIPKLKRLLLSTKGEIVFPESDEFWGTNDGEGGENNLGKILMKLRDEFRKE